MFRLTRWLDTPSRRVTGMQPHRLSVEHLEGREVPALFTVTNLLDSGAGSLRDAVDQANNENTNPGQDTIVFSSNLFPGGTVNLNTVGSTSFGPSALGITSDIVIDGFVNYSSGAGITIARDSSAADMRLFCVETTGTLTLRAVTVSGGVARGGNGGSSSLGGAGGGAAGLGGAIFNTGSFVLENSLLTENSAIGGNGGAYDPLAGNTVGGGGGGGLAGNGAASVDGSSAGLGGAGGGGDGGAIERDGSAGGFGGGGGGGGSAYLTFGFVRAGGAGGFGGGGGGGGGSMLGRGAAGPGESGGGNAGKSGANFGGAGGGGAGLGGAIFNYGGTVTITNSTISGNSAIGGMGGTSSYGFSTGADGRASGGGLFNLNGFSKITQSTFSDNIGGAVSLLSHDLTAGVAKDGHTRLLLINSILANSHGADDLAMNGSYGYEGEAQNPNLIEKCTEYAGYNGPDPMLAPLADNGGPTRTHAITSDSPAFNAGNKDVVTDLTTDQRGIGFNRMVGSNVDFGAFELPDNTPPEVLSIGLTEDHYYPLLKLTSVDYYVVFSEPVTGVDVDDFVVTPVFHGYWDRSSGASVTSVVPSYQPNTYIVTVNTGISECALRLDLRDSGTDIVDLAGNPSGGFTQGEVCFVDTAPPAINGVLGPVSGSYTVGQTLDFAIGFTEKAEYSGNPRLALTVGNRTVYADFLSAQNDYILNFRYTIQPGDLDTDGITLSGIIDQTEGSIVDWLGNTGTYAFTPPDLSGVKVDAVDKPAPPPPAPVPPAPVPPPPAHVSVPRVILASVTGGTPHGTSIAVIDPTTGQKTRELVPFAGFSGALAVAAGDLNGDGIADVVVGAGGGGGPRVVVIDGATGAELVSFFAFNPAFQGGLTVATADVTGDGVTDLVVGAGPGGGPNVKVFDGRTMAEVFSFFAYDPAYLGGVTVAAGDVNGDQRADIVTGTGAGSSSHVKAFSGFDLAILHSFFAYAPTFTGGVNVAVGDVNGDGFADIVTGAGSGAGPHVKVFDGRDGHELASFLAFAGEFTGGVSVGTTDADRDGLADLIAGTGPGGAPHVKVFDGETLAPLFSGYVGNSNLLGGIHVG